MVQQQQQQRLVRSKTQPVKLSGFGDIVKQAGAALKKDKTTISQTRAQTISSTSVQATKMTTTTTITNAKAKNFEKWEEFRERKLAKMKQHKINVERRMQASYNNDSQMYWSQRADKLKRYPKHETLHPSWYTENIYSNQSIDLETDEFNCSSDKYCKYQDETGYSAAYGINGYGKRHHVKHMDSRYRYPKSQSCCFGSGYDERPKPILMPKSSSFGGASGNISCMHSSARSTTAQDICIHPVAVQPPKIITNPNNIQTMYSNTHESESYMEVRPHNDAKNAVNRRGFRKLYCWENEHEQNMMKENDLYGSMVPHLEHDCYTKNAEIYQIERDQNYFKKQNSMMHGGHASSNANYIRNSWDNRHRDSVPSAYKMNINEINGNYTEEYSDMGYDISDKSHLHELDNHLPFESEEYLIVHKPRNSFGDSSSSYCHGIYSTDIDPSNERSECYLMGDKNNFDASISMDYSMNKNRYDGSHSMKSKCMLEVKPPNRYDDSSSDSTVDDLYDFNFDFINQFNDLDYRNNNNNCNGNGHSHGNTNTNYNNHNNNINSNKNLLLNDNLKVCNANYKEKNYTKYRQNLDDITDNDINDIDIEHECGSYDDDIDIE